MEKIIIKFIRLLRRGGMRIALSEVEDALRGISALGIEDKAEVKAILRATLLKNEDDRTFFEMMLRLFFREEAAFTTAVTAEPPAGECSNHAGEKGTGGMSLRASRFYGLLRNRDSAAALAEVESALRENDLSALSPREAEEQLKITLGWFSASYALKVNDDIEGLILLEDLERYLRNRCTYKPLENWTAEDLETYDFAARDFAALDETQVKAMEKRVARLGAKLASRYSYRLKRAHRGIPDMRRLLADTAQRGHIPTELRRLDKIRNRADLIILADISGSMGIYSSFCLQLVYAMKRKFRDMRVFLFIDSVAEASLAFDRRTVAEAVAEAIDKAYPKRTGRTGEMCTTTGVSDYGKALETFHRRYGGCVTADTTVIIIGDGCTNWFPPRPEELKALRKQAKKVLWFNPAPHGQWNKGDSMIRLYAPYCDVLAECGTLNQLEQAVRHLK